MPVCWYGALFGRYSGMTFIHPFKNLVQSKNNLYSESGMEDRWLSVDEIAAYLGIKRDTVYKWIGDKNMPAHRVGRLWKFRKEEVDDWVRSGGASENKLGN
jgi:excisionase family DNA binding protein